MKSFLSCLFDSFPIRQGCTFKERSEYIIDMTGGYLTISSFIIKKIFIELIYLMRFYYWQARLHKD